MTDIGSNMSGPEITGLEQGLREKSAQPVRGETPRVSQAIKPQTASPRRHGVWESLTASLDLACRGYLCMHLVDCDPVSDPECSAAGKKIVVRQVPGLSDREH